MDLLTFLAAMTKALAWPAVALLLLYAGRKQFPALLERLLEFTFPGGSLKFGKKFDEARGLTQRVAGTLSATEAPDQAALSGHVGHDDPYLDLADRYPEAAVFTGIQRGRGNPPR